MSSSAPTDQSGPAPRASRRRRALVVAAVVVVVVAAVAIVSALTGGPVPSNNATSGDQPTSALVGHEVPGFTLKGLAGGHVSAPWERGRPSVLIFFASWCVPCKGEIPKVAAYVRAHHFGDVVVLGLDEGDATGSARAMVRRDGVTFAVAEDPNENVASGTFGFQTIPETVFVSAKGVVRQVYFGAIPPAKLATGVAKLRA